MNVSFKTYFALLTIVHVYSFEIFIHFSGFYNR